MIQIHKLRPMKDITKRHYIYGTIDHNHNIDTILRKSTTICCVFQGKPPLNGDPFRGD